MTLMVLGGILLLLGIIVLFKKNEGQTEIDFLGIKVKSNNSAVLLITLGAIFGGIGALKYEGYDTAQQTASGNSPSSPSNYDNTIPASHRDIDFNASFPQACQDLTTLVSALQKSPESVRGDVYNSPVNGPKEYKSKYSILSLPAFMTTNLNGNALVQIEIPRNTTNTYEEMQRLVYAFIERCFTGFKSKQLDVMMQGNQYVGRDYEFEDGMTISVLKRARTDIGTQMPPLSLYVTNYLMFVNR